MRNIFLFFLLLSISFTSCFFYTFTDASIPPEVKTIRINPFINNALLVNPMLTTIALNELRNKIQNQTKLQIINKGTPDYEITGVITDYSVGFTNIGANNAVTKNQLSLTINYIFVNNIEELVPNVKSQDFSLTQKQEFDASKSLNSVENELIKDMVPLITTQIFNKIFSSW